MSGAMWIDIALLAILVGVVVIYTVRGFAKSVIGFVVMIASLLVASIFGPAIGRLLYNSFMFEAIGGIVLVALESVFKGVGGSIDGEAIISSLPDAIKHLLSFSGADLDSLGAEITSAGKLAAEGLEHASETVAAPIAECISNIVACLLLFIVAHVVFKLISKLVLKVFELPVLRTLNRLAGFLMGLLVGFLLCWGVALALRLVFGMIALSNPAFLELADPAETFLYSFFTGIGA